MKIFICILVLGIIFSFPPFAFAESSYVLPYPPPMPGSLLYKVRLISEQIQKYWFFGDFGQFSYNLKQSDKYLVEAKTLFDYKQFLLAYRALQKSDAYFEKIYPDLLFARKNGKNILEKEITLGKAAQKHIEELTRVKRTVPSVFDWTPERDHPTTLNLWERLDASINVREKRL